MTQSASHNSPPIILLICNFIFDQHTDVQIHLPHYSSVYFPRRKMIRWFIKPPTAPGHGHHEQSARLWWRRVSLPQPSSPAWTRPPSPATARTTRWVRPGRMERWRRRLTASAWRRWIGMRGMETRRTPGFRWWFYMILLSEMGGAQNPKNRRGSIDSKNGAAHWTGTPFLPAQVDQSDDIASKIKCRKECQKRCLIECQNLSDWHVRNCQELWEYMPERNRLCRNMPYIFPDDMS